MLFAGSKFVGVAAAAFLLTLSGAQASFLDKPSVATYWGQVKKQYEQSKISNILNVH